MSDRMHRCPADDCTGHDDLAEVFVHGFRLIAAGQAQIVRELRHLGRVPPHVQDGLNNLDEQIRAASRALSHQSARAHHNQGGPA